MADPAPLSDPYGFRRRGILFAVAAPSGAGKSTLTRKLREADPAVTLSLSVTTRKRRDHEADGVHYDFVDRETFDRMKDEGVFIEWAEVFGNRYGTRRDRVEGALGAGHDVLFDIDPQGVRQLFEKAPNDVVSVYILPPSMEELRRRLEGRGTESAEGIARRLADARDEIRHGLAFDYVLVNDELERCFADLRAALAAERLKRSRQTGLGAFAERLLAAPLPRGILSFASPSSGDFLYSKRLTVSVAAGMVEIRIWTARLVHGGPA